MVRYLASVVVLTVVASISAQDKPTEPAKPQDPKPTPKQTPESKEKAPESVRQASGDAVKTAGGQSSALDFTVKDMDGKDVQLSKYRGKVVLIVNVASKCGLTPQYEQLQALHAKYADKGLVVLAFPANNFGGQEPGTNEQIKQFCTEKYSVTFPVLAKISVKGDDQADLYKFLTSKERNGEFGGDIEWNFAKFLVGRDGKTIARFHPKVRPDDPKATKAIEDALAQDHR